jgi:bifunctional non-homologous end joining protein LigD
MRRTVGKRVKHAGRSPDMAKQPKTAVAPMAEEAASARLHSQEGNSDKVYHLDLVASGGGWIVNYANGRRGSTLATGTKTAAGPVAYPAARKIYDSVLREKLGKGYVPTGEAAATYVQADRNHSGIQCALLNPVELEDAESFLSDPEWFAQEKHNGRRMLMRKVGDVLDGINRKGLTVGYPASMATPLLPIRQDFVIDGEAIGETIYVFDVLEASGHPAGPDLRHLPCEQRLAILADLLGDAASPNGSVVLVGTARTEAEKRRLWDAVLAGNGEGMVFKHRHAPYPTGRPASGGSLIKCKFWESCSAVVDAVNAKRSVSLRLLRDGEWTDVGNCTVPPNHPVPAPGTVVEIRYLFANEGGCLQEPTYLGTRSDIAPADCTLAQLKYKPGAGPTGAGFAP